MSRAVMLAGKMLPYWVINLLQIVIMLEASALLFGLKLGPSPDRLVVVSLAAAATATGLGVLVSALARTEARIGGLGTLLLLMMSALGGSFIPCFDARVAKNARTLDAARVGARRVSRLDGAQVRTG